MEINVNKYKLSRFFNLPSIRQTERQERLAPEDNMYTNVHEIHNNLYLFGLEVEVEQVKNATVAYNTIPYWSLTTDNSLRNNGVEFVSEPLRGNQIEKALRQLQASLPKTHEFSPRTSVHVHMNARDLTVSQILSLVLVYTSIEDLLFNWVGHDRNKNVFCIKITETEYVKMFLDFMTNPSNTVRTWNKYTALNLHPIQEKGTVEFRHMYGTADIPTILTWVNFLSCIKSYIKNNPFHSILNTITNLNSNSNYEGYLQDIFGKWLSEFNIKHPQEYQNMMEENVSYVKLTSIHMEPTGLDITRQIEEVPQPTRVPSRRPANPYTTFEQRIQSTIARLQTQTNTIQDDVTQTAAEPTNPTVGFFTQH